MVLWLLAAVVSGYDNDMVKMLLSKIEDQLQMAQSERVEAQSGQKEQYGRPSKRGYSSDAVEPGYKKIHSHEEGLAALCSNLGCYTIGGGSDNDRLEQCYSDCALVPECSHFNYCPAGASCTSGQGRCCPRNCDATPTVANGDLVTTWHGWDVYERTNGVDIPEDNWPTEAIPHGAHEGSCLRSRDGTIDQSAGSYLNIYLDECLEKCTRLEACYGASYLYYDWGAVCWLSHKDDNPMLETPCLTVAHHTYAYVVEASPTSCFRPIDGAGEIHDISLDDCLVECQKNDDCLGVSFSDRYADGLRYCFLASIAQKPVLETPCISWGSWDSYTVVACDEITTAVGYWSPIGSTSESMTWSRQTGITRENSQTVTDSYSNSASVTVSAGFEFSGVTAGIEVTGTTSKEMSEANSQMFSLTETTKFTFGPTTRAGQMWQWVFNLDGACGMAKGEGMDIVITPNRYEIPCCLPGHFKDPNFPEADDCVPSFGDTETYNLCSCEDNPTGNPHCVEEEAGTTALWLDIAAAEKAEDLFF